MTQLEIRVRSPPCYKRCQGALQFYSVALPSIGKRSPVKNYKMFKYLVFACILAFAAARPQIITPIVETYEAAPLFANAVRTYPLAEIEHQLPYFPANVVFASKPLVERLQIALK
ncbi:uncharacterized protein LOC119649464 isoform X2 [Hermetia illucens]|uniref:uncharacterized protein LOC119649464 isoform X2 n=1 Tax=Hermetia illucens TaxID=343691 RepID=UPI0018CC5676|nr:uncharacterized protein LOC119649464 isoform X2 [Hermetia illucens]